MAANPFDEFDSPAATPANPFDEFDAKPATKAGPIRRIAGDMIAAPLAQGIVGVPEAAVGAVDLVTGGRVGKALQEGVAIPGTDARLRFDPRAAKQMIGDALYSDEQKAANQKVAEADGFLPTLQAAVENPSTIVRSAVESLPSMGAGGVVGRIARAAVPALGAIGAGALGEGVVAAGQNAEQVRQEDPNGTLSAGQSALLAGSGAITGLISRFSGGLANRMGLGDAETALVAGKLGPVGKEAAKKAAEKGVARKIGEGFITEGMLEELPQSMQEQVAQNLAQGKPWNEGLGNAAAMGLLTGGVIGGAVAPLHSGTQQQDAPPPPAPKPLLLTNQPDPLIGFPDGTVARKSEMEAYIASLPEDQRVRETARLLGRTKPADETELGAAPHRSSDIQETLRQTVQPSVEATHAQDFTTSPGAAPQPPEQVNYEPVLGDNPAIQGRVDTTQHRGPVNVNLEPQGPISRAAAVAPPPETLPPAPGEGEGETKPGKGETERPKAETPAPAPVAVDPNAGPISRAAAQVQQPQQPQQPAPAAAPAEEPLTPEQAEWLAQRPGLQGMPRARILTAWNWEQARNAVHRAYGDYNRADEALKRIEDQTLAESGGMYPGPGDAERLAKFEARRLDLMRAEAERVTKEAQTAGTFENKLREQRTDKQLEAIVQSMHKANLDEIELGRRELAELERQGRITAADVAELERIATTAKDSTEAAFGLHEFLAGKDVAGRETTQQRGEAANDQPRAEGPSAAAQGQPKQDSRETAYTPQPGDIVVDDHFEAAHAGSTSPLNDRKEPSDAQKEAENYPVGRTRVAGMTVSIENGQGSTRTWKGEDGQTGETLMADHYGRLLGTKGADSTPQKLQHLDVLIKVGTPRDWSGEPVIIDTINPKTGSFDEHKIVFGATDVQDARAVFARNYGGSQERIGAATPVPLAKFKAWAYDGQQKTQPYGKLKAPVAPATPAPKPAEKPAEKPAAPALRLGTTPGDAQPVTVAGDGTVMVGKYPALDFDSGEPVKLPEGERGPLQIRRALTDAGAVGQRMRFFGAGEHGASDVTGKINTPAPTQAEGTPEQRWDAMTPAQRGEVLAKTVAKEKTRARVVGQAWAELDASWQRAIERVMGDGKMAKPVEEAPKVPETAPDPSEKAAPENGDSAALEAAGFEKAKEGWVRKREGLREHIRQAGGKFVLVHHFDQQGSVALPSLRIGAFDTAAEAIAATLPEKPKAPTMADRIRADGDKALAAARAELPAGYTIDDVPGKGLTLKRGDTVLVEGIGRSNAGEAVRQAKLDAEKQAKPAQTSTRRFTLSSGNKVNIAEAADAGTFHVMVNDGPDHWASWGTFRIGNDGAPVNVKARANWAMQDVREAAALFAANYKGGPVDKPAAQSDNTPAEVAPGPVAVAGSKPDEAPAANSTVAAPSQGERSQQASATPPAAPSAQAPSADDTRGKADTRGQQGKPAETAPGAKPARRQPGEPGYTLLDARNDLLELRTIEQGFNVADDRLIERIRRQEKLVKEMEAEEKAAAKPAPSADTLRAQADLNNALADLADLLGKPFRANIVPEQEAQLVPILTRVLDAAFRLGFHKFKDAARFALDTIRDKIGPDVADALTLEHLQGAYIAMSGGKAGADKIGEVGKVTDKAEILTAPAAVETPAPSADTQRQESNDERTDVRGQGPQALDEVAAQEGAGPQGQRPAGGDAAGSGQGDAAPGAGADAAGLPSARGGRSGSGAARAPATGAGRGNRAVGARGARKSGKGVPAEDAGLKQPPGTPNIPAANFRITPDLRLGRGGEVEKFNDNVAAIRTLKTIESERRRATPEEQAVLARYVGWGGLANAFPDPRSGEFKDAWKERGPMLRELLTPSEYAAARRSTRNAHYTSEAVVSSMWKMAERLGFRGGLVLESSMGTGNFLGLAPEGVPARFIGVEYDSLTSRIGQMLYPQAAVLHSGFQKVPMANGMFSLNIGNPPFGSESLRFQYKPELAGVSIHNQFFRAGLDAVRPGGLQIMVVSRFLMDAQDYASRVALATKGRLVAAFRLPDTAFKENARTEVVTDIVVLQRREASEEQDVADILRWSQSRPSDKDMAKMTKEERARFDSLMNGPLVRELDWMATAKVPDPLGGEPMVVNRYFARNPQHILGTLERSGSMQHGADITVRLNDAAQLPKLLQKAVDGLPEDISNIPEEVLARTEERFTQLAEALRIAVANEEPGHLSVTPDGVLQRVIEREAPEGGGDMLARQTITPFSPWSEQLSMDSEGRWYRLEVVTGEDGKPVKQVKNGKATKRNMYERTTYASEADVPAALRLGQTDYLKLRDIVRLRDIIKQQLVLETEDAPAAQMEGNRKELAKAYGAFVEQHGPLNRPANLRLAMTMPDGGLVAALESEYEPARTAAAAAKSGLPTQDERSVPAPILSERVVPKYEPPTDAKSPADALAISLSERGRVDMERIAQLLGKTQDEAAAELQAGDKPLVFRDPETQQWETADAYLSGMVKRKLEAARAANMELNVRALEAVQPEPWTAEQVTAQMGSTWIPSDVYADFATHLMGGNARVSFAPATNTFSLQVQGLDATKAAEWSSEGAPASYILQRLMNSQAVLVMETDSDGNTRIDQEATTLAISKSREIVNEFGEWVFKDAARRGRLVDIFNEKFNVRTTRQFDGSHLKLPGKVPDTVLKMRRHQMNAIWRGISSRFLLADHVVGAGKTFTAIARIMERRRMGLARKPVVMVPNHLVEQWATDVYRMYPGAKVLAAGQKDFEAKRRRRLFSRIATGDWDIVIVPHSSFGFIGIAPETESRFLEGELREAQKAVDDAWEQAREDGQDNGRRKPFGVKEAERLLEKLQTRMDKITSGARDKLLTFEQLGIDDLTVDEAHEFKNLYYSSRLTGVRGMGNKTGSRKAADLYNKVRILRENGGAVTFLTGTPISNSAVEMFTMMRYLAADELQEMGLTHFDAWRAQFVEATPAFEPTEAGRLKEVTRLGRTWSNMRSLMDLYYQFTDAVTIDDIKKWYAEDNGGAEFPVPKVKGGDRKLVKMVPTQAQQRMLDEILAGFDHLPDIDDPYERNIARLQLMDRARKVSLDVRAVDRTIKSDERGGKLATVSAEIKRIYDASAPRRGTQLVFLDRSVPKAQGDDKRIKEYDDLVARRDKAVRDGDEDGYQDAVDALDRFDSKEIEELRAAQGGGWNAYQQIKDNLVAAGIPAGEVRFIQEANTDEQKQALFDAVKGGKVRVLIGSTQRMGAGTNVQDRLVALHHVDVTWKPSDIEQREGRIIRQGNLFVMPQIDGRDNLLFDPSFEAEILAYATERTIDAKMWDLNATKLRTINGIRKYDGAFTMDFEDEDSVSMAEMAALASGNPLLLERVTLESQINLLELQERSHRRRMYGVMDEIQRAENALEKNPERITRGEAAAAAAKERMQAYEASMQGRSITIEGQSFTARMDAAQAAQQAIETQQAGDEKARWTLTVDGKRVTSKAALEEAISDALGDVEAFQAEVDGKVTRRRAVAARVAAEKVAGMSVGDSATVGRMMGADIVADVTSWGSGSNYKSLTLSLIDNGKTVASTSLDSVLVDGQFSAQAIRPAFDRLVGEVGRAALFDASYYRGQMTRAERDLPGLRARQNEPFAKQQELADKRARLARVVQILAGAAPAIEPDASTNLAQTGDPIANETDVLFALTQPGALMSQQEVREQIAAARGMPVQRAQAIVDSLTAGWKGGIEVKVVATPQDLPGGGKPGARGMYAKGVGYIVASAHKDRAAIGRTIAHEVIQHHGLRAALGTDGWQRLMAQIQAAANAGNPEVAAAREWVRRVYRRADGSALLREGGSIEADEVAAHLIERSVDAQGNMRPRLQWLKWVWSKVASFLRDTMGINVPFTMSELHGIWVEARRGIERGDGGPGPSGAPVPDMASQDSKPGPLYALSDAQLVGNTGRAYTPEQERAMRNVGWVNDPITLKQRIADLRKNAGKILAQGLVDQFAPVKDISREAYGLLRLAKGASGAFEVLLQGGQLKIVDGAYDFDEGKRGGVVQRLLMPLQGEHHDFFRWVAANRAQQLMAEDRERLFTPEDIRALKSLADGQLAFDYTLQHGPRAGQATRSRAEAYADSLKVFNEFNRNTLDLAEQSGLIDGESRKLWEHEFYVPFYRVADEGEGGIRGMNIKNGVVRQQAFKQLKGGSQKLNADLLENTLMNWAHLIDAAAKNRAAKATLEAMQNMGAAVEAREQDVRAMARSVGKRNNVVWFMDEGRQRHFLVDDPYLMTAVSALEFAGFRSPVMRAMGAFKHALTLGVTASPFFKVRNLIRDSVQAIASGPLAYNPLTNIRQGWAATSPESDAYFRLMAGGGTIHFGTMMEGSEAKRVQALVDAGVDRATILDSAGKVKAFYRKTVEPLITAYNELGNRGEAINRAALYQQLRAQGVSHAEASLQARDLMDFSMQGSFNTVRFLTQVVPFANARMQGLYKLGRAAAEDPARFSAVLGAVALLSIGLLAAYRDDDDWKKREDWDRNNYWWFKAGGIAYRIPKPFEIGAIATLAERSWELAFEKEMTGERFRAQVVALMGDNLSMNPIPQIVKPVLDVYSNKDSFTGRAIESMGMERLRPDYRFREDTTMFARGLSTTLNAGARLVGGSAPSPVQIDHLMRGYFGWLGSMIVSAGDVIARPATGQPDRPQPDYWKVLTGAMVSNLEDAPSRYVSTAYQQARELEQAYGTWRHLIREGKMAEAQAFREDYAEELARYRHVEAVKRAETRINQLRRQVEQGTGTPEEKRMRIRELDRQADQIARRLAPAG